MNPATVCDETTTRRRYEEALARDSLYLVQRTVNETTARIPSHVPRDDLVSAGMAGLAHAARHFEPQRGVPFDRYATTRIRGSILDELRGLDWASRPVRAKARTLAGYKESLTAKLGRVPTLEEISQTSGLTITEIENLMSDVHRSVVLNYESIIAAGNAEFLLPAGPDDPEEALLSQERVHCLGAAINALPDSMQTVIRGYFLGERSVTEIAAELGVTQSRVSQLRSEALELLRDGMNTQLDPSRLAPLRSASGRVSRRRANYRAAIQPTTATG